MVAAAERDREEVIIQKVGLSMAREMEPDTEPGKALEQGTVTAPDLKGRAAETEQIRRYCTLVSK